MILDACSYIYGRYMQKVCIGVDIGVALLGYLLGQDRLSWPCWLQMPHVRLCFLGGGGASSSSPSS